MIARMVKIEIVGPNGMLLPVLTLLRELGVCQIERDQTGFIATRDEQKVRSLLLDEKTLAERIFYEELRTRIDELFALLPRVETRESYLDAVSVLDSVAELLPRHGAQCREWCRERESLQKELAQLNRYRAFLDALEPHLARLPVWNTLEFIGVTLKEPGALEDLMRVMSRLTQDRFEIVSALAADGTQVALITLEKALAEKVRGVLGEQRVPELTFPAELAELPFPERVAALRARGGEAVAGVAALDGELARFARRWGAIYARVREWLEDRLTLLKNVAYLHQTGMCFCIHGWTPEEDVARLEKEAESSFGGQVVVEKMQILEQDLDQVPVTLRNPPYFRPFELFARLLPLPRYASLDPTPFIAIGFPLFFGMILGDAGYGLILIGLSLVLARVRGKQDTLRDAARILLVCACYSVVFGLCYGEFFGEVGARLLGLEGPFLVDRRRAVIPMLYLALAIGLVHVMIGLLLGALTALKRKTGKEALFKLAHVALLLCLAALFLSLAEIVPRLLARPLVLTLLLLIPVLFFSGGLLAPLELLKTVGNIVSYARIMALGLASVLLAGVANSFAGMTGNIVVGVLLALLFHAVNLVLGVFSPAIHALRLHYVEFYSKFVVPGGRKFEPLKK